MSYEHLDVAELEALMSVEDETVQAARRRMSQIQSALQKKSRHWLEVGRFEGMTKEQVAEHYALTQGVKLGR